MPRIRTYQAQTLPKGGISARRATGEDFGAGVGQAVAGMGQTTQALADFLEQKKEADARLWREKKLAEARTQWIQRLNEMENSAQEGAPEFTQNFIDEYDQWSQQAVESAPTPLSKKEFDADLESLKAQFVSRTVAFEANSAAKMRVNQFKTALEDNVNAVRADPSMAESVMAQNLRIIDGLQLPGDAKAELRRAQEESVAAAQFDGLLDRTTTAGQAQALARDLRESDKWKKQLSEAEYSRALDRALRLVEQHKAKAQQSFLSGLPEMFREIRAGVDNGLTEAQIRANAPDPVTAEKLVRNLNYSREIGSYARTVGTASPGEIAAMYASISTRTRTPGNYDLDVDAEAAFIEAVKARNKALEEDPAKFVMGVDEKVRAAYQAIADGDDSTEARMEYTNAMRAEQTRLGVLPEAVRLVPNEYAQQIARSMTLVDETPEGAQQAYDTLQSLVAQWGEDWPTVRRQLYEDKALDGTVAVAADMNSINQTQPAMDLLRFSAVGEKVLQTQIPEFDSVKGEVNQAATEALTDLKLTLQGQVGGDRAYANYHRAAVTLALGYVSRGASPGNAVQDAVGALTAGHSFVGSYRVPKVSEQALVDENAVSIGAAYLKGKVPGLGYQMPKSAFTGEATKEDADIVLEQDGRWVTNGDETGLVFVWPDGSPVQMEDGRLVEYSWTELQAAALDAQAAALREVTPDTPTGSPFSSSSEKRLERARRLEAEARRLRGE